MKKIPEIFQNPEHQKDFETKGYVKVQFLDQEQINYLDQLFDDLHPNLPDSGFVAGTYYPDLDYKKKASDEIVKAFEKSYERIFKDYQAFGGSFLFKIPSANSDLVLHQDWTIVDESEAVAINCWVPLCDTNVENGTLMVLPGAHNYNFHVHRAPTLNFFFTGNEETVMKHLVPMNAKAGEAVLLNQSLVHYSPPNTSKKIRKAITAGVKTKGHGMHFYYFDKEKNEQKLDMYTMDEDFLIRFDDFGKDIFTPPIHGKFLKTIDYTLPQPSKEELEAKIQFFLEKAGMKKAPTSILDKLKAFFNAH